MISISCFFLASYLMLAGSYTIGSWLSMKQLDKYWYLFPFVLCWCLKATVEELIEYFK